MNYKITEYYYNKNLLERLINKSWIVFLWFTDWLMVFKEKVQTSRQLTTLKESDKFFNQFKDIKKPIIDYDLMNKIAKELNISWANEKPLLGKFLNYWLAWQSEWVKPQWKRTRDKLWTFEIAGRFRTMMSNESIKKEKNKPKLTTFW